MFKSFKGEIDGIKIHYLSNEEEAISRTITFKRNIIVLNKKQDTRLLLSLSKGQAISDGMKYELSKEYNEKDDKVFMIRTYSGEYKRNLKLNTWNIVKANIIHGRYWLHREYDWIYKYIITTVITVIVALYANKKGFNEGYQEGLKANKSQTQSANQKP